MQVVLQRREKRGRFRGEKRKNAIRDDGQSKLPLSTHKKIVTYEANQSIYGSSGCTFSNDDK